MSENIIEVENLKKHFPIMGGVLLRQVAAVHAVDGVSFSIHKTWRNFGVSGRKRVWENNSWENNSATYRTNSRQGSLPRA